MNKEFQVHMLNDVGKEKATAIANCFDECLEGLKLLCDTNCREFSIVRTKLEEASFFAKKSMANVPSNNA